MSPTIKVTEKSINQWAQLKVHPRESFEEMINRHLRLVKANEEPLDAKDLQDIAKSLQDFKNNRYKSNAELFAKLKD